MIKRYACEYPLLVLDSDIAFPIKLERTAKDRYRLTYGLEVYDNLRRSDAAQLMGFCIFHALECDGKLG